MTYPDSCQISWHFQVFQKSGHPATTVHNGLQFMMLRYTSALLHWQSRRARTLLCVLETYHCRLLLHRPIIIDCCSLNLSLKKPQRTDEIGFLTTNNDRAMSVSTHAQTKLTVKTKYSLLLWNVARITIYHFTVTYVVHLSTRLTK